MGVPEDVLLNSPNVVGFESKEMRISTETPSHTVPSTSKIRDMLTVGHWVLAGDGHYSTTKRKLTAIGSQRESTCDKSKYW